MHLRLLGSALVIAVGMGLPVAAQDKPGECPGTYTGRDHPACPPARSLAWIDCPAHWPGDPARAVHDSLLYTNFSRVGPDVDRWELDHHPEGGQLVCYYDSDARTASHRLIIESPGPISQWGWHKTPRGMTFGCRVPKALAAHPPVIHVAEPVTRTMALEGFRLGMSREQVRHRAGAEGYTVEEAGPEWLVLQRPNRRMEVVFGKTARTREVIQYLDGGSNTEHSKAMFFRFGPYRTLYPLKPNDPTNDNWMKEVWESPDNTVTIESWPRTPFGDLPTLRLVDYRPKQWWQQ